MPILDPQPYRVKALKSVMDNVIANVFHVCFYNKILYIEHEIALPTIRLFDV